MPRAALTAGLPRPPKHDPEALILPSNLEAEKATLGAALVQPTTADYVVDHLTPTDYFRRAHQTIFTAIRTLRQQAVSVDYLTVKTELVRLKQLDQVGGPAYLTALTDGMPRATSVADYVGILRDLHARRAVIGYAQLTLDLVATGEHPSTTLLADADRRLTDLQRGHLDGRLQSLGETVPALMENLEWRVAHRGEVTGIETGFKSINDLTLGWQAGDLIIIAARPSIGKTTFVLNTGTAAAQLGKAVAVFSLEMRRRQLEYRLLSSLSNVPLTRILSGYVQQADYAPISVAMSQIGHLPMHLDDRSGQTVWEIRAACRRLKAESGLDLIIIDYVQLMPGTLERKGSTRNEEVTDISRRLKALADEVQAPVLLLSQLSRAGEKRTDLRPRLSDLRESGALEQDADLVCFLHRKHHRMGGVTQFIIDKQRNGPAGTMNLTLDREIVTFTDGGEDPPPEPEAPRKKKVVRVGGES